MNLNCDPKLFKSYDIRYEMFPEFPYIYINLPLNNNNWNEIFLAIKKKSILIGKIL